MGKGSDLIPVIFRKAQNRIQDPAKLRRLINLIEFDMVLTNPPFGKKSSVTYVTEEGEIRRESQTIVRDDFWTSTSNKQLSFVQHVKTILKINGRAAVVVAEDLGEE